MSMRPKLLLMYVASYERMIGRTCRKCYTIFDTKRDYCCVKGKDECFADIRLVEKGLVQDEKMAEKLYMKKLVDDRRKLKTKKFFRGALRNECMVFDYRPPGCRSHFCYRWDDYIRKNPLDFVHANLRAVSVPKLLEILKSEYEYGIKLAYPGGFIVYTSNPQRIKKEVMGLLEKMRLKHFVTRAELMEMDRNHKMGVEVIMDPDGIVGEPGLFGTLINNSTFMLVRMKMNLGSTGFRHSNILITTADPEGVAKESPASLKAFHALKAFWIEG